MTSKVNIQFNDNKLLSGLYGVYNEHLERIGTQLGVVLISRGNRLRIEGNRDNTNTALTVLNTLWLYLEKGYPINIHDIDTVIRAASSHAPSPTRPLPPQKNGSPHPRSESQEKYLQALARYDLVFGIGPAGTGKTYLTVAHGVRLLQAGEVDRIIISRPAVEAGENLGFLPGDMRDKIDPYLRPLYDALHEILSSETVAKYLKKGDIEVAPLAFMRGRTISNAFIILDEAQNTTPLQMKMFLTRLGPGARMAVIGDITQIDRSERSGLIDSLEVLNATEGVGIVYFSADHVIRHSLVGRIVQAYAQSKP